MATKLPKAGPPDDTSLDEYIASFCDAPFSRGEVNRLSRVLAHVAASQIQRELRARAVTPLMEVGQRSFGGSSARHHLDAWVHTAEDGLMLGLDVKGLNAAASARRNWNNRIGDFEQLATRHHSLNPKAVIGGVLAIPAEDMSEELLGKIEFAMRKRGGRTHTANQVDQLDAACLLVISKERRELLADAPAVAGPSAVLRFDNFCARMADLYVERWQ